MSQRERRMPWWEVVRLQQEEASRAAYLSAIRGDRAQYQQDRDEIVSIVRKHVARALVHRWAE